jgi:hypothetical protein
MIENLKEVQLEKEPNSEELNELIECLNRKGATYNLPPIKLSVSGILLRGRKFTPPNNWDLVKEQISEWIKQLELDDKYFNRK